MSVVLAKPGKPVQSVTPVRCAPVAASRWRTPSGRLSRSAALLLGAVLVLLAMVWGAASGAYAIAPAQLPSIGWDGLRSLLGGAVQQGPEHLVFLNIRLPRLLMGVAAGAGLGLAGALMQDRKSVV